jgi:hypothetical protein
MIGNIKSSEVKTNRDGTKKVVVLQVEIEEEEDLQSVELYPGCNIDFRPEDDGANVLIDNDSTSHKMTAACHDGQVSEVEKGEIEIYSLSGGKRKAKHRCKKDGSHVFNDGEDWLVQYTEMKKAFDQLKSDFDTHVSTYNGHIHITTATVAATPTPGVIAPTTTTSKPSTANMAPAKLQNMRVE